MRNVFKTVAVGLMVAGLLFALPACGGNECEKKCTEAVEQAKGQIKSLPEAAQKEAMKQVDGMLGQCKKACAGS